MSLNAGCGTAEAPDLGEAGDAGLAGVAVPVAAVDFPEEAVLCGRGRRHGGGGPTMLIFAEQDVEQLRQFVDAGLAD